MMRNMDDYRMVITNSAIIINNYEPGTCSTLERNFMVWDPLYHRYNVIGMYYDPNTKKLYLPRGSDLFYIKRKLYSVYGEDKVTSAFLREHKFGYTTNIKMKKMPRNDRQYEALQFMLCKDKYAINSSKTQFSVNLNTGMGKTYCAVGTLSYLGIRTVIITSQSGILRQWGEKILEYTTLPSSEIIQLEGSSTLERIISGKSTLTNKSIYLITHSTIQSFASKCGWDKVGELFDKLGIGIKIFDEAHQNFTNTYMIDFFTNVWRTYYLTATPIRSSKDENKIYQIYMKNIPSIVLFDGDLDPHTKYISIKYNSNPKPMDLVKMKGPYGLNHNAYIDYLTKNNRFWIMFDYIFALVYKSGGRALFYIGTNNAILKARDRILFNYPELIDDIGIYTSISEDKVYERSKKYILSTTKSAGAGEDIPFLKYSVVMAEPFKSEVLARQTFGRTRDKDTIYLELVDVGFKQLVAYYNYKKPIFAKYATECKNMNVDNSKLNEIVERTRIMTMNRFKEAISESAYPQEAIKEIKRKTMMRPGIISYYGSDVNNKNTPGV